DLTGEKRGCRGKGSFPGGNRGERGEQKKEKKERKETIFFANPHIDIPCFNLLNRSVHRIIESYFFIKRLCIREKKSKMVTVCNCHYAGVMSRRTQIAESAA
ncbi:MAG: hypothetical protein LUE29_01650, partial [Lachnospiraceae bacterium]|nr:hypothetical protein [Lachnospiraceae bacterium]